MNISHNLVAAFSLIVISAALVGCGNDRARGPGFGDSAIGVDSGMPTDGSPGDGAMSDSDTPGDGGGGFDTGLPPTTCSFDVKLDGLPTDPLCDDTWTEEGATLAFVNTTADDCSAGRCSYMTDPASSQVWLYPGRLEVRLQSASCGATSVEVDINDYCGVGCTKAFAYAGATEVARAENTGSGVETLILSSTTPIDRVAVSSCEGQVTEIRFR